MTTEMANLSGADLYGANLRRAWVPIQMPRWNMALRDDGWAFIGCEEHSPQEWREHGAEYAAKYGESGWWARWGHIALAIIEANEIAAAERAAL